VELLVVIAIIGILVALLLPALQVARDAGRRTQCANNLKQIGLALHAYHEAHKSFPTQTTGARSDGGSCQSGFASWLVPILPYIEQKGLYESIDKNIGMMDTCDLASASKYWNLTISANHRNAPAAATQIASFLCPSDSFVAQSSVMGTAQPAPGSYAGNVGLPPDSTGIDGTGAPLMKSNGFFGMLNPRTPSSWQQPRVSIKHFKDGLSNTAAVSERLIANAKTMAELGGGPIALQSYCGGTTGMSRSLPSWIDYCGHVTLPDATVSSTQGRAWISGWTFAANTYMHVMPINQRSCHLYGGEDDGINLVTPSSRHTGGVNVLWGDGRVALIAESVDLRTWWSAGSRDGQEATTIAE